jgi:hypothetical protein
MPRIEELFAFVIQDGPTADDEGVPAEWIGAAWFPLMGADIARVESLMPLAQGLADKTGKSLRILKSVKLEQVGEIHPRGGVR